MKCDWHIKSICVTGRADVDTKLVVMKHWSSVVSLKALGHRIWSTNSATPFTMWLLSQVSKWSVCTSTCAPGSKCERDSMDKCWIIANPCCKILIINHFSQEWCWPFMQVWHMAAHRTTAAAVTPTQLLSACQITMSLTGPDFIQHPCWRSSGSG